MRCPPQVLDYSIREYLASSKLPQMITADCAPPVPPEGHRSHRNVLSTRPAPHRTLACMHLIQWEMFTSCISDFLNQHPLKSLICDIFEDGPCVNELITFPGVPVLPAPGDITMLGVWVALYPLKSLEAILHFAFPETKAYKAGLRGFSDPDEEVYFPDEEIFQYIKWGIHNPEQKTPYVNDSPSRLNIAIQPPWILSSEDLDFFANWQEFPQFDVTCPNNPFNSSERLWAKIWDLCAETRCPWFVVSTYWGWVFGVFSKGWHRAWVSDVIKDTDTNPSVMECLTYWICSAMGIPGGFRVPEVPEDVRCVAYPVYVPTSDGGGRMSSIVPSVSWVASSREIEHVSDVSRSDLTVVPGHHPRKLPPTLKSREKIRSWVAHLSEAPPSWREGSPALSDVSDSSTDSTVKDYRDEQMFEGGWLTGNPGEARADAYDH